MARQKALMPSSDYSSFLYMNCVVPTAQCRSKDVLRCSAALTSKLFDGSDVCGRQSSDANLLSLCDSDCRSVLAISPTMKGAKTLAGVDVATSVLGMVRFMRSNCEQNSACSLHMYMSNPDQVLKIALLAGLLFFDLTEFKIKISILFLLFASLVATITQITIEGVFLTRYRNGGSEQWLTGCEVLSACSVNQGPASEMSQIYNEVSSLMTIVGVEIAANVINLLMMCAMVFLENQGRSQGNGRNIGQHILFALEVLFEILQVVGSGIALNSLNANIDPVNELADSLVGTFSESASLCLLPCCEMTPWC